MTLQMLRLVATGAALVAVGIEDAGYHGVSPVILFVPFVLRPEREKPFG